MQIATDEAAVLQNGYMEPNYQNVNNFLIKRTLIKIVSFLVIKIANFGMYVVCRSIFGDKKLSGDC